MKKSCWVLLIATFLTACEQKPLVPDRLVHFALPESSNVTPQPTPPPYKPNCYGTLYAETNKRLDGGTSIDFDHKRSITKEQVNDGKAEAYKYDGKSPRIIVQDKPLGTPPEIARVQRGYVSHFVGAFINDGLVSWRAIDLDRKEAIVVIRKVYDKRATQTKPFGDPVFPEWDTTSLVRKWSSDERTEMEVVSFERLENSQLDAFVCVANAVIAAPLPKEPSAPIMFSDTLSSAQDLYMRGTSPDDEKIYVVTREITDSGPIDVVLRGILGIKSSYTW